VERADGTARVFEAGAIQTNENQTVSGVIDLFIEAVERGMPSPISAQMVLPAMKAVFACAESAERGGEVVCC
jgi:predicted dehydrogenase